MHLAGWLTTSLLLAEGLLQVGVAIRVLTRRLPTGVAASWLTLVLFFPIGGMIAYLLVGESRIGRIRARRERSIHPDYAAYLRRLRERTGDIPRDLSFMDARLAREAENAIGLPALGGNQVDLLASVNDFFDAIIAEVDRADRSVMMEFFIWDQAGRVTEVAEALVRAAARGVVCRLLVDAVGSRGFLGSHHGRELVASGVRVRAALPATLGRTPILRRVDHRNHRKLVVIDERVAFTGSMNMADPAFFKTKAGIGPWVDLAARVRGPAVELYTLALARDWETETQENLSDMRGALEAGPPGRSGPMALQVVPSGPGTAAGEIQALILSSIYAAEDTLTITTPYFVPDASVLTALQSAARRGVDVTVIVPERSDTVLTHYAGRAFFQDLLDAGVCIAEFRGGLLHTKSIVVDEEIALFGTVNLDPRSFWLNFELTTIVYDDDLARALRKRQLKYLEQCRIVDPETWRKRSFLIKLASDVAQLFSPLL